MMFCKYIEYCFCFFSDKFIELRIWIDRNVKYLYGNI